MTRQLLLHLGARDRSLLLRCALPQDAPRGSRLAWLTITHLGGTGPSLLAAGLPLAACCGLHRASKLALLTLLLSHLLVQLVKRTVVRTRPAKMERFVSLVAEPDCFAFPSGHATASMSVTLAYGTVFPAWLVPLLLLALLVGFSRVRLRVHYPGDVIAGQLIALETARGLSALQLSGSDSQRFTRSGLTSSALTPQELEPGSDPWRWRPCGDPSCLGRDRETDGA